MSSELPRRDEWVHLRLDVDGMIQEAFGDTHALFGVSPPALFHRDCVELVAPRSRLALRNLLNMALDQPRIGRFRLASPNGDLCSALWTLAPAGEGRIWCVVSAPPPEHSPYDLPPALAKVLDRANHVVFFCDPLGHFINLNPSLTRISGYSRCELESLNFAELVHPDDRLLAQSIFLGALGGSGQQAEIRIFTKDHRQQHIHFTNAPLWDKEQIVGVVGIGSDVTAERMWSTALSDAQERLEQAQRIAGLGRWAFDFKSRKAHWSPELFALLEMNPRDFSNDYAGFRRLIHPDDMERVTQHHRNVVRDRRALDLECRIVRPDGSLRWIHERGEISRDSRGRLLRIEGTLQDITECKRAEEELHLARDALARMGESLFILDAKRQVLSANAAFCRLVGCARSAIQDQAPDFLLAPGQDIAALDSLWQHLKTIGTWQGLLPGRRMDGSPLTLHLSLSLARDARGRITHYIGLCRESPALPLLVAESTDHPQDRDAVTALLNRSSLMRQLTLSVPVAARQDDHLALLWLDLDHFRSINESLDPAVGDEILQEVAQLFQSLLGEQSTLFHMGGDVFAVLLEGSAATARATALAESLLEGLNRPLPVAGMLLGLSASIGIASLTSGEQADAADLVRQAETAMYQAKRHRHCYRLATRSRQLTQPSPMGAHELRQALQNDELFLVYQPIYDSLGGNRDQISGVEALVRWAHPIRGILAPDSFLPLAERIGLLPSLGQRVLDLALRQLALWRRSDAVQLRMAVNLAPAQLVNPQLPAQIIAALQSNAVPADALTLEITENALMAHPERALESLRALRQIGVQVAIDDFGMGYSSFNYLKQYPFDVLKIDRSFTMALPASTQDAAIVEAILSMSQRLNLSVIAEGVETEDQWTFLTERGCQELQGFWLSRPLSGEALGQLLRNTPNH
jgi:diguanylate cyclase (GGDEF)-like protein/PAS domain S-box-containing protein